MSETGKSVAPGKWLKGRRGRRARAVQHACTMLGLEHGQGHLDNLYLAAYEDGLRDAYAMSAQQARAWFRDAHGLYDPLFRKQIEEEDRRYLEESAEHARHCEGRA